MLGQSSEDEVLKNYLDFMREAIRLKAYLAKVLSKPSKTADI